MMTLIQGKIPAYTPCPFRFQCAHVENGTCHHRGLEHIVPFSCGTARAYVLINKSPKVYD